MEVELRKSEVPALAELKDLCRHECTAERCADAVREFGWSLEHVPEDMKTPEMCRRALAASAELGYGHLALLHHIPFAEVCMEAIRDWYGEGRADLYEVASAIRPEVFDGKMADFLVAEDGRCLSLLPVHLQTPERAAKAVEVSGASALLSDRVKPGLKTPELWRKCAEHSWMSFVMIPWRERSPEACLTAYLNYPGMIHAQSPCRAATGGQLLQRVLAVPPDGADDGREIHLRSDGGLLRGKADGGQVHRGARWFPERP